MKDEDLETGESQLDHETGEEMASAADHNTRTNAETGEPEVGAKQQRIQRKRMFQVPRTVLAESPVTEPDKSRLVTSAVADLFSDCPQPFTMTCHGSRNIRSIVFMLPTLFLFPAWTTVLAIICELCIHAWAHKRNKALQNHSVVFRSPLHPITSNFCAYCKSDSLMQKIGKMQDERKLRVDNRKTHSVSSPDFLPNIKQLFS